MYHEAFTNGFFDGMRLKELPDSAAIYSALQEEVGFPEAGQLQVALRLGALHFPIFSLFLSLSLSSTLPPHTHTVICIYIYIYSSSYSLPLFQSYTLVPVPVPLSNFIFRS